MKAEQRKELETNTLADKVGQAMQRVKGSSRRSVLIYVVVGAALIIALYLGYRWMVISKQEASMQWLTFDDGSRAHLLELEGQKTPAGRAARFQIAWLLYWEKGVRMIGADKMGALNAVRQASVLYQNLANECKEDKDAIFEPQALLGIAVCEETRSVQDVGNLTRAKEAYAAVKDAYPDSAEGKFAQKRLERLNDKTKLKELEGVYEELQKSLQIPALQQGGGLPPGFFQQPKEKGEKEPGK